MGTGGPHKLAAVLAITARYAAGIDRAELGELAGCGEDLVSNIEDGQTDPSLDTVDRIANSAGLEIRAGWNDRAHPAYLEVSEREVDWLAAALRSEQDHKPPIGSPLREQDPCLSPDSPRK